MKRLAQPAVVQIKVVSVTDVHDAALRADAPLGVVATGETIPGEECILDTELGRIGFEQLNTGERAPTYSNKCIVNTVKKIKIIQYCIHHDHRLIMYQ